jgi:hypothetical protein
MTRPNVLVGAAEGQVTGVAGAGRRAPPDVLFSGCRRLLRGPILLMAVRHVQITMVRRLLRAMSRLFKISPQWQRL